MTAEEIAAIAEMIRSSGIPEDLNRWAKMTPQALEANEAARSNWRTAMGDKPTTKEQRLREMRETTAGAAAPPEPTKENDTVAKTKGEPKAAKPKPERKTKAAPKSAAEKSKDATWKPGTIGAVARAAILAGKSNEDALKAVKKEFPDGGTNLGNISWYRNDLRKRGLLKQEAA